MGTSLSKSSVVDANVWLALVSQRHPDHHLVRRWADNLAVREAGLCRTVQLTVTRLLGMRTVVGVEAMPAGEAWLRLQELLDDERIEFLPEPLGIDTILPTLFRYREPTPNLVNDAYLAAFAIASGRRLVTRDRGFLEFRGLDVEILS